MLRIRNHPATVAWCTILSHWMAQAISILCPWESGNPWEPPTLKNSLKVNALLLGPAFHLCVRSAPLSILWWGQVSSLCLEGSCPDLFIQSELKSDLNFLSTVTSSVTFTSREAHLPTPSLPERIYHLLNTFTWRNGNPLQYSCLDNPVYRGAWWAAVYVIAQRHNWSNLAAAAAAAATHSLSTFRGHYLMHVSYLRVGTDLLLAPWSLQISRQTCLHIYVSLPG